MQDHSDTKQRLLESAIKLFSRKWYGTVSVAEVCREASLSNGVFYRYFRDKEELFRSILNSVHEMIAQAIAEAYASAEREAGTDRFERFVRAIVQFSADHPDLIAVFREGQYRFVDHERRLEELYQISLGRVLGREAGVEENVFALGGIRFCAIRAALQGVAIDTESILRILRGGLFPGTSFSAERVFAGPVVPLPMSVEEGSREGLLRAGRRLFGEKGFFETNIHEITDAANLSVGAFYTHFQSKEAFFAELIHSVGHDLRRFLTANTPSGLNGLEAEMRGLWLFALYLQSDRNCYNIVREAEFVLPSEVASYYGAFVEGYRKRTFAAEGLAPGLDERTAIEFLLGVNHYLGIATAFADAFGNLRLKVESIGAYLADGFSSILEGAKS